MICISPCPQVSDKRAPSSRPANCRDRASRQCIELPPGMRSGSWASRHECIELSTGTLSASWTTPTRVHRIRDHHFREIGRPDTSANQGYYPHQTASHTRKQTRQKTIQDHAAHVCRCLRPAGSPSCCSQRREADNRIDCPCIRGLLFNKSTAASFDV